MELTHLGHSSFKLRGKTTTIVTDPFDPQMVGIKPAKTEADIVTVSHQHDDHNFTSAVLGNPLLITGPGEYQVKGVEIIGVSTYHDNSQGSLRGTNIIYHIKIDGIYIVHLGDLGHKLNDKQVELLNGVDVLLIPVGGHFTISAEEANQVVVQLEPRVVVPMHYNHPGLNQANFSKLSALDVFLKEIGQEEVQPQPKLYLTRDKLPPETEVIVLE